MSEIIRHYSDKQKIAMQILRDYGPKLVGNHPLDIVFVVPKQPAPMAWVGYDKPNTVFLNMNTPMSRIANTVCHELVHCQQFLSGRVTREDLMYSFAGALGRYHWWEVEAHDIADKLFNY